MCVSYCTINFGYFHHTTGQNVVIDDINVVDFLEALTKRIIIEFWILL